MPFHGLHALAGVHEQGLWLIADFIHQLLAWRVRMSGVDLATRVCCRIGIVNDGRMIYFGPYNPDEMNVHIPVDHLLFATVEAGDGAVQKSVVRAGLTQV